MHTQHARQLIFTHFTLNKDNAQLTQMKVNEQQELNSIFECSSSEIHANAAAQVSITCMRDSAMHVHNENAHAQCDKLDVRLPHQQASSFIHLLITT